MAKLSAGINGPFRGKVGTVVGSSWKGQPYMKGPNKERTSKVTKKEKDNQNKFARTHHWLKPLLVFLRQGFKDYDYPIEGMNAAMSWNLLNAFEPNGQTTQINPAIVQVSYGDLPLSENMTVEKTAPDELLFTWGSDPVDGGSPYDQVMLLAYDIKNAAASFNITGQFRSTGMDVLKIPATKGRTYHVYMSFTAADRSRQSHSVYMGTINS
ncbi:DUF6266 family protein [Paraflavitalea sp. CAU 1676]|uniref:DUF6266 family protein n=1 Tax=Paraflavitalea sp. CAU 1676 TaxID=3032598 RepID=UPI0023DAB1DA|nr:DUF6266 family protein [Paraflavitalea sp. CAU 1676]MDF2186858.1 DUF6266 family protein [Paraflavitalea sp. CAU 1676]